MARINVSLDPNELSQIPAFLRTLYSEDPGEAAGPDLPPGDSGASAVADTTAGNPPPVDPSLGGADNPAGQPASSNAPAQPATKLSTLQQILKGQQDIQQAPDVQPPLTVPGGSSPLPPADLAQSMVDEQRPLHKTFAEDHPTLAKILGLATEFVQDAAPGLGSRTFGEGFSTAAAQPFLRTERAQELSKTQAQIDQMKSMVILPNGLQVPFALAQRIYPTMLTEQGKNSRNQQNNDTKLTIADKNRAIALRKQGLKPNPDDPDGQPVPLDYDELTPAEQGKIDLQNARKAALEAQAQLAKFRSDPNNPQYQLAAKRLQIAAQNAATAAGKLGLDSKKYLADYFGMDEHGNALPGAPTDDNGRPIGPRVANAGKTPADRLKRGDLAANAIHNLNNIEEIIDRRDDLFGPIMGRLTTLKDWMGSDDPDIAAIGTEIHNYALASNGAHGVRSQQAVQDTENEILNHFKRGPKGAMGGIRAAKDSLLDFVKDQQLGHKARPVNPTNPKQPPANPNGQPPPTHIYNPNTGTIAPINH
jgi:hypothetical protein